MPSIILESGKLTNEQKIALVREFTESASRITGIPEAKFSVFLHENAPENIGVGGQLRSEIKK